MTDYKHGLKPWEENMVIPHQIYLLIQMEVYMWHETILHTVLLIL